MPAKLFVEYHRNDAPWFEELKPHLDIAQDAGQLTYVDSQSIPSGTNIVEWRDARLREASAIVCLVSADFVARMPGDLKSHRDKFIPVCVRPVMLDATVFGGLAPLPKGQKTLSQRADRAVALMEVVQGLIGLSKVSPPSPAPQPPAPQPPAPRPEIRPGLVTPPVDVLTLAALPQGMRIEGVDEEVRRIEAVLERTHGARATGEMIKLRSKWAVREEDLSHFLLHLKPHLLHFVAHGSKDGEIVLTDADQKPAPLKAERLAELLGIIPRNIRGVILNICYSNASAKTLVETPGPTLFSVGMEGVIEAEPAVAFSGGFYGGLAFGCTLDEAHKLGKFAAKSNAPQLHVREGIDPESYKLVVS